MRLFSATVVVVAVLVAAAAPPILPLSLLPIAAAAAPQFEGARDGPLREERLREEFRDPDPRRSRRVDVYDAVLPPASLLAAMDLCRSHAGRHVDWSSYFARPSPPSALSPLERVLDSILEAVDDEGRYVEYWSRHVYMNVDTHCDVDEDELEKGGRLRSPDMGHVLYLSVGDDVVAPTFVFPDRRVGWDAVDVGPNAERNDPSEVEMVVVPAVPGRLLRFDGRAMHAVPRPADRYLLSEEDEYALRREHLNDDDDNYEYSDEDEEEEDDVDGEWYDWEQRGLGMKDQQERFVLLFNTWSDGPPRGVSLDQTGGVSASSGGNGDNSGSEEMTAEAGSSRVAAAVLDERKGDTKGQQETMATTPKEGAKEDPPLSEAEVIRKWEGEFGPSLSRLRCSPRSDWATVPIAPPPPAEPSLLPPTPDETDDVSLWVHLMNNDAGHGRSVHPERYAGLRATRWAAEKVAQAVREKTRVSRFVLRPRRRGSGEEAATATPGGNEAARARSEGAGKDETR